MFFGRAVAGESFVQHFEVGHFVYVEHAPVGQTSRAALAFYLIRQEAGLSVLHSVVMRFGNSWFVLVGEADLMARGDGIQKLAMNFRQPIAYYQSWAVWGDWIVLRHLRI